MYYVFKTQRYYIAIVFVINTCQSFYSCANLSFDTLSPTVISIEKKMKFESTYNLKVCNLIAPTLCIGYGVWSFYHNLPKKIDELIREEVLYFRPDRTKYDNYTQYAPVVCTYGLNVAGVKGRHNYRDLTIIYLTSQIFTGIFTLPVKFCRLRERPDNSNFHSFPSGHTTTAFSSAQLMYREFQNTHFWVSISGTTFALFTGISRVINNKHWVSDVVIGAGLGILSTELAYCLFPKIDKMLRRKKTLENSRSFTLLSPFFQPQGIGFLVSHHF